MGVNQLGEWGEIDENWGCANSCYVGMVSGMVSGFKKLHSILLDKRCESKATRLTYQQGVVVVIYVFQLPQNINDE